MHELTSLVAAAVDRVGSRLRVEGEVVGAKLSNGGHLYFTLKDSAEDASLDAVMFAGQLARAGRALAEGARVVVTGRPSVYPQRGRLQFVAERAEPLGRGALLEALERLRAKLAAEGLFAPDRKRPLPSDPRVVGVVTSAGGAVIHDIVRVARRRGPVRIVLASAAVQGVGAARGLVKALSLLSQHPEVDVIIVGRGGGSADDLTAFCDEALVRAVAACRVPVVSAVGHDVDVPLLDLAADVRAATPSQAAELVVPDFASRSTELTHLEGRLVGALRRRLSDEEARLERARRRLGTPERVLGSARQALDSLADRLSAAIAAPLRREGRAVTALEQRLTNRHPRTVMASEAARVVALERALETAMRVGLASRREQLGAAAGALEALSPLSVLARGYAITTKKDGSIVRSATEVAPGDELAVRVHQGSFQVRVSESSSPTGPGARSPRRKQAP